MLRGVWSSHSLHDVIVVSDFYAMQVRGMFLVLVIFFLSILANARMVSIFASAGIFSLPSQNESDQWLELDVAGLDLKNPRILASCCILEDARMKSDCGMIL